MKKLLATLSLALVVVLGAVGFSACKKNGVLGTYKFAEIIVEIPEGATDEEKAFINSTKATLEAMNKDSKIVLEKNGKGKMIAKNPEDGAEASTALTWTQKDKTITIKYKQGSQDVTADLKLDGNKLIIEDEGLKLVYKK